jgi:tetratricopeptide (TPR) repeat protein
MKFVGFVFSALLVLFLCASVHAQVNNQCLDEAKRLQSAATATKNYDSAVQKATECVGQSPKSAAVYIVRGAIYRSKGDFDLALADLNKAIQIDAKNAEAYHQRGMTNRAIYEKDYDKKGNKDAALADFTKAIELDPKKGESYLSRAVMRRNETGTGYLVLLPDFNKAIALLTAANDTTVLAQAYYERGFLYSLEGQSSLGNADYDTALKIKPDYTAPLLLRATNNKIAGNFDAALADYDMILKTDPSATAYSDRASIYEQKGDMTKAIADYRAAFALDPSNGYLKEKLAKIDKKAAPATRPVAPPASTMTAEQYAARGREQADKKDFDGAIASFTECLRLQADAQACYAFRGYAYGLKGDLSASMTDFDKAIKLNPAVPAIYFIRGIMFAQLGKADRAAEDFRAVLKIDPNNQQAQAALQRLGAKP